MSRLKVKRGKVRLRVVEDTAESEDSAVRPASPRTLMNTIVRYFLDLGIRCSIYT